MHTIDTLAEILPIAAKMAPQSGLHGIGRSFLAWPEVARKSAALAAQLENLGVRSGDRVVVLLPRSFDAFIAMHGVIGAGAVAVPLDPLGLPGHTEAIAREVEPRLAIADGSVGARLLGTLLAHGDEPVIVCGEAAPLEECGVSRERLHSFESACASDLTATNSTRISPEDPCYMIFTSGSTGAPKGILHSHASAVAYGVEAVARHGLQIDDRVAGTAPLHTDMSTLELWAAPIAGASVSLITEGEVRFPVSLAKRLEADRSTVVYTVPALLNQLVDRGLLNDRDLGSIRQISYGGEPYAPSALRRLMAAFEAVVINVYGPAEVNAVTTHILDGPPRNDEEIPLGTPWHGVELRVIDEHGHTLAVSGTGELHVSSPTMMLGYWAGPERTAAQNSSVDARRFYATGDVVTVDAAGAMTFIGRLDDQIKVRGVRIDLQLVESTLSTDPAISVAVAGIVQSVDSYAHLEAVVVVSSGSQFDEQELRRRCEKSLPPAAVPQTIHLAEELPFTSSGKVDRRSVRNGLADPAGWTAR